jgi:fatty acid-binding protein DegV
VHSLRAGLDFLHNAVSRYPSVEGLAVEHTTNSEYADILVERLSKTYPGVPIYRSILSPVLGTYSGPNAMALTVLEAEKKQ